MSPTKKGTVKIKYLGYLTEYYGKEQEVEIMEEKRIIDLIKLPPDVDPNDLIYLLNGKPAKPHMKVKPGDTITVMPHISGGKNN